MTAKEAIKDRCRDCYGWQCADDTCALYGLAKQKRRGSGTDRYAAIKSYCLWCMNGLPVRQCSCAGCAIRRYRGALSGTSKVDFEQQKPRSLPPSRAHKAKVDNR
jgi:hypothetical protein